MNIIIENHISFICLTDKYLIIKGQFTNICLDLHKLGHGLSLGC